MESKETSLGSSSATISSLSRRRFLGRVGDCTAVIAAAASLPSFVAPEYASAEEIGPLTDEQRRSRL